MDVMTMNRFDCLSIDQLSEIVGGNVAYDIGYGVGQVSYIAVEILKLRKKDSRLLITLIFMRVKKNQRYKFSSSK